MQQKFIFLSQHFLRTGYQLRKGV